MSLPRYPKYKDSGVEWLGEVPEHWTVERLKFNARLVTEKAVDKTNPIALENIESWSARLIPTETDFQGNGIAFQRGDILFGKLRPYLAKAYLAESNGEAVGDFHVLRPSGDVQGRFLIYYLLNRDTIDIIDGSTFGARMPRVSWEFMGNMPLPIAPIEEQVRLVAFLGLETGKIDALVEEQRQLIELLKEKRQAVISHAVTKGLNPDVPMKDSGIEWLGKVPAHWEVAALKRFWTVTDCKHITAEFVEEGIPLASIREVQSRYVSLENSKRTTAFFYEQLIEGRRKPAVGDLIFSRNATVGEVAQVTANHPLFAMGQDVCLLRKNYEFYSSDYFQCVIRSKVVLEQLQNLMVGSTFMRVNVEEIRGLVVPMPPPVEQFRIAEFITNETDKTDQLIVQATHAIDLLQERRTALISAAVTGKIDVRGLVKDEVMSTKECTA